MASERKTGSAIPAGILRPTTQLDERVEPEQGSEVAQAVEEIGQAEARTPRKARKVVKSPGEKLEGRRLYLSKGVHFRLMMLAYQRGKNLSEMAEEVLDKNLPKYDVNRVG